MNQKQLLKNLQYLVVYGTDVDVLCVGTPKLIGDSIGPLVGTMLEEARLFHNVKVIGTLANPLTSKNYKQRLKELRKDSYIVVVDAIIGPTAPSFEIVQGPMQPGAAVSKKPDPIGDMSVKCYTGTSLSALMACDLHCAYTMSRDVAALLISALSYRLE